jgi:hypothetical protein
MNGGTIADVLRSSAVWVQSGGSFVMDGGSITKNRCTNAGSMSVIFIEGAGSSFTMSGGEISDNYTSMNSVTYGGAIRVNSGARFDMTGGVIKNCYVNPATQCGGAVYIASGGAFTKSGGIIYGVDAQSTGDWNRIRNNPNPFDAYLGQGYAVYCVDGAKFRDNTSYAVDAMNSAIAGSGGGWE